ncbi:hypothetical protein FQN57_003230 [Myotisia sp. PD_48]|nr:hypothetical protein FQN57_003230 [Myotisia sp. PD_48]
MGESSVGNRKPKRAQKPTNPSLREGIEVFLTNNLPESLLPSHDIDKALLLASLPKRFTIYEPLLLLPPNFFKISPLWQTLIELLDEAQLQKLYACIASTFSPLGVTHIAINAPISVRTANGLENRIRSPTNITPLYGDFGPLPSSASPSDPPFYDGQIFHPTTSDFEAAFWVRTVQNAGIVQIWAPLFTMFSRGNIVEKARILGLQSHFAGLTETELSQPIEDISVIDMYAGIGYFTFSYLKKGIGRVWAWELNGWSVEGLRRGCDANGWGVEIVKVDDEGNLDAPSTFVDTLDDDHKKVIVFHGDNTFAVKVMGELKSQLRKRNKWKNIRHANLGLLPSSKDSWAAAATLIDQDMGGWAHVHENVGVNDILTKKKVLAEEFQQLRSNYHKVTGLNNIASSVECLHVEKVKTYAPGVMHCVYDVQIQPTNSNINP